MMQRPYQLIIFDWNGTLSPDLALSSESALYPGVKELLAALNDKGYLLAVATAYSRRGLDQALADAKVSHEFITTVTADDGYIKPDPRMLQLIIDYAQVEREGTLMVGDTMADIQMAENAGVDYVAIGKRLVSSSMMAEKSPKALLTDICDIGTLLLKEE